MRSRVVPLLWEIWRQGRTSALAIAAACGLSWLIDYIERGSPPGPNPSLHNEVLGCLSFLMLFGMFSYVESSGDRGMGRFPRRHFTLPVSTLKLVAVPVISGIIATLLLYVLWMGRLSAEPSDRPWVAVLLGSFMVFYQATLWILERFGPLRLLVLGAIGFAFFWICFLPDQGDISFWRSRTALGGIIGGLALVQLGLVWRFVSRLRSGGENGPSRPGMVVERITTAVLRRRTGFRSAQAAHFWFEWRCSGVGYAALVAGAMALLVVPASVLARHTPGSVSRILIVALALPLVVAMPAGLAFSKPVFWSDELSLQSFVAVRPLGDAELIAIKLKIAAVATLVGWLPVFGFLGAWLLFWADSASADQFAVWMRGVDGWPVAALVVASAMFLSWRFLVAGLWAGMSGRRALFMGSLAPIGLVIIGAAVFDVAKLPGWIAADLGHLTPFLWTGVLVVGVKSWLAVRGLRGTTRPRPWWYVAMWLAGVGCLFGLGVILVSRADQGLPERDLRLLRAALLLLAALLMPMARVAWAPWFLGRNRHQP